MTQNPPTTAPLLADPAALKRLKFPPGLRFGALSPQQRTQYISLMNAVASLRAAATTHSVDSAAHRKLLSVADNLEHHPHLNPYPPRVQLADQRSHHFDLSVPFEIQDGTLLLPFPRTVATTLQHYFHARQWPELNYQSASQLLVQVIQALGAARPGPHTFLSASPARWLSSEGEQRAAETLVWHLSYGQFITGLPSSVQLSPTTSG